MFKKTYKQNFTEFINKSNTNINKNPNTLDSMKGTINKFDNFNK